MFRTYMGNHMVLDVSHGVLQRGGRVQKLQVGKIEAYTFDAFEILVPFSPETELYKCVMF